MELDDCGRDVLLTFRRLYTQDNQIERTIIMVIKKPKGTLTLFGNDTNNQCEAIKAFMEEHRVPPKSYKNLTEALVESRLVSNGMGGIRIRDDQA